MLATLGKGLVFLNLIAAFGLATWALSLTVNQPDWLDKPEGFTAAMEDPDATDTNNLERVKDKIEKLLTTLKATQNSLAARNSAVIAAEMERDLRAAQLQRKLTDARTGTFRALQYRPGSGLLDLTANTEVITGIDGKPLAGLDAIQKDISDSVTASKAYTDASTQLRVRFRDLANEITLLDEEIDRQKLILANAEIEGHYLADRRTDWSEQVRTLERRAKQIADRLAEINAAPKKSPSDRTTQLIKP